MKYNIPKFNLVYPHIIIFFLIKVPVVTWLSIYWGKTMKLVTEKSIKMDCSNYKNSIVNIRWVVTYAMTSQYAYFSGDKSSYIPY